MALIPNHSCDPILLSCKVGTEPCCHKANNWGWRYLVLTMGALTFTMFMSRLCFFFHLFESPKFLLSQGRQSEAVAAVHGVAYRNGKQTWLSEDILNEIGGYPGATEDQVFSKSDAVKNHLKRFSTERIKPLFATKKIGLNTALVWYCR